MKQEIVFLFIIHVNMITICRGYRDNSMFTVTENTTYSVTTWGYPWPPQIHWLDPYINLSSFPQEIIDGIVLGDKLKKEIRIYSNSLFGWIIDIRADGDLADAHYNKYYTNNTENMFICYPKFAQFMDKLYRPLTKLEIARCGNYTAGIWDWQKRQGQWKYMWNILKYRMIGMFALAGAVSLTGVFGNLLIIRCIIGFQDMRSATNYLLASLTVADLFVTLVLPVNAVINGCFPYFFRITIHGCRFFAYFEKWLFLTSLFHLTAVSFERYFAICHPMKVKTICTTRRAKLVIAVLWIVAMICAVPEIFTRQEIREDSGYYCSIYPFPNKRYRGPGNQFRRFALIISHRGAELVLLYLVQVGIIIHNYVQVSRSLFLSLSDFARLKEGSSWQQNEEITRRLKVVKMLVAIVIIFFVLWTPRLLYICLSYFPNIPIHLGGYIYDRPWFELVSYINSCVNAFVYYQSSDQFKKAFRRALACGKSGCKQSLGLTKHEAPTGSSMRHRKLEQPSSVAVVSSITGNVGKLTQQSDPVSMSQRG